MNAVEWIGLVLIFIFAFFNLAACEYDPRLRLDDNGADAFGEPNRGNCDTPRRALLSTTKMTIWFASLFR